MRATTGKAHKIGACGRDLPGDGRPSRSGRIVQADRGDRSERAGSCRRIGAGKAPPRSTVTRPRWRVGPRSRWHPASIARQGPIHRHPAAMARRAPLHRHPASMARRALIHRLPPARRQGRATRNATSPDDPDPSRAVAKGAIRLIVQADRGDRTELAGACRRIERSRR